MISIRLDKAIVCCCLTMAYIFLPKYGYTDVLRGGGNDIISHLLYPLCHVNMWHLAANIVFLCLLPCRLYIMPCYVCAVLCSFLPSLTEEPTAGFSGILFAIVGVSWGRVGRFKDMLKNNWPFLVIPVFIPHVNAFIHFYCMVAGYLWGAYIQAKTK